MDTTKLLEAGLAIEAALSAATIHGLMTNPAYSDILKAGVSGQLRLVQELDAIDRFYYLVPFGADNKTQALLVVDGLSGEFQAAETYLDAQRNLFLEPEEVANQITAAAIKIEGKNLILRDGAYVLYPSMVWQACRQSHSQFYPFYMLIIGGITLYVETRTHKVYRTLTPF